MVGGSCTRQPLPLLGVPCCYFYIFVQATAYSGLELRAHGQIDIKLSQVKVKSKFKDPVRTKPRAIEFCVSKCLKAASLNSEFIHLLVSGITPSLRMRDFH